MGTKKRCCGCSLQTGTKFIGFLSLVGFSVQFGFSLLECSSLNFENDDLDPIYAFVAISSAVTCSALLVCSVLVLHAAYNDDRPGFLIPWLFADSVMIGIQAIVLVSDGFVLAATGRVAHGVATVIVVTAALVIGIYLWTVVFNYYRQLKSKELVKKLKHFAYLTDDIEVN